MEAKTTPEYSPWKCYMFGARPDSKGIDYRPLKGHEPNWLARWMMLVLLDCLWVKEPTNKEVGG